MNAVDFPEIVGMLKNHASAAIRAEYLHRIEKRDVDDGQIVRLRRAACKEEPLASILANRKPEGWWYMRSMGGMYKKYQGTSWSLLFAAELGAPPDHGDFRDSCRHFMDVCFIEDVSDSSDDELSGAAERPANTESPGTRGRAGAGERSVAAGSRGAEGPANVGAFANYARKSHLWPCFNAHACFFLAHFGFLEDERVRRAFRGLASAAGPDGGLRCHVMDVSLNPTCIMALPKFLKAAALLNARKRKSLLGDSVRSALDKLIAVDLDAYQPVEAAAWDRAIAGKSMRDVRAMKAKYKFSGERRRKSSWSKFQFPLHYDSDLLEVLLCFGRLGAGRNAVLEAGAMRVLEMRGKDGLWGAGRSLKGKLWADLPDWNAWISLRALEVLGYYGPR